MDFRFDDEQLALRDAIAAFCTHELGLDEIAAREVHIADAGWWKGLADMGVFGMLVPEDRAGSGGGTVEAAIVCEQLGATLAPGPIVWSVIAAPLVPGVLTGAVRVTGVVAGSPVVVEHAAESDLVLVVHDDRVEGCPASALPAPVHGEPFDPLTPAVAYVDLPHGDVIGTAADTRALLLAGTVLTAAFLVGVAQGALDVATGYARERRQFGVPIGSFQAIKHLLADMYVRVELARSAAYAAAAITDDVRAGDAMSAARIAKLLAGEAAVANSRTAVQVLGGMGFTWAMLPHYFLKRAWVLEEAFGTGDDHALALAAEIAAG